MDTRIEWTALWQWNVVTDDDREALMGTIREAGEETEALPVQAGGSDPSLLSDLVGR